MAMFNEKTLSRWTQEAEENLKGCFENTAGMHSVSHMEMITLS